MFCATSYLFFQTLQLLAFAANGSAQFFLRLAKHFFGLAFNVFFVHGVSFAMLTEPVMARDPRLGAS
jgi:hypothetical protein